MCGRNRIAVACLGVMCLLGLGVFAADDAKEAKPEKTKKEKEVPQVTAVDINTASAKELQALPGIGKVLSERIVEYREQNGKFELIDDLLKVKGVRAKSLDKIRPLLKLEGGKVDINTADAAQLTTLPGIGEGTAKAIVEYREANGTFAAVADLAKVPGLGAKTVEKLQDAITVGE